MGRESTKSFSGTFTRSMDAKKRVSVPAPWLGEEGEIFHVIPHPSERYLMVMPPEEFTLWEQRFQESPLSPAEKRKAIRQFYGNALEASADKQGRILLSEKHCDRAGLQNEVIFVGGRSRFEIWSKDHYDAVSSSDASIYQKAAEAIGM